MKCDMIHTTTNSSTALNVAELIERGVHESTDTAQSREQLVTDNSTPDEVDSSVTDGTTRLEKSIVRLLTPMIPDVAVMEINDPEDSVDDVTTIGAVLCAFSARTKTGFETVWVAGQS
jgi:hypothetical protein